MAENKKSFLLYADLIHTVKKLPDLEAGLLFKTILSYVNDENPHPENLLVEISFEPIKQQLKRDLRHWETIKEKRSEAGKASAEAKKLAKEAEQNPTKSTSVESVQQKSTNSTVSVNDNVTVTVNVNGTVIKIEDKSSTRGEAFNEFFNQRKKNKKTMTAGAVKLTYSELEKLAPGNVNHQIKILNQSTINGWAGVFQIKETGIVKQKPSSLSRAEELYNLGKNGTN